MLRITSEVSGSNLDDPLIFSRKLMSTVFGKTLLCKTFGLLTPYFITYTHNNVNNFNRFS